MRIKLLRLLFACLLGQVACASEPGAGGDAEPGKIAAHQSAAQWYEDTQAIMGTRVQVEFLSDQPSRAQELLDQVMAEMHRVDQAFSPYKENSELSTLNRLAPQSWVQVSDELFDLLVKSKQVSQLTDGAFDVTYASVGRYYDYRQGRAPDAKTIEAAIHAINYHYINWIPNLTAFATNTPRSMWIWVALPKGTRWIGGLTF